MTDNNLMTVQNDTVVEMAYNLSVDGEEVEASTLEYLHGHSNIIPGLEQPMTGMKVGETRDVVAKAGDAYGEYDPEQVVSVPRAAFPEDFEIRLGETMRLRDSSGHVFSGVTTALDEENVELDLNHPMAGKDLNFKVTVLSIRPGTEDEIMQGHLHSGCDSCGDSGCGDGGCSDGCCG